MVNLASSYDALGRYADAIKLYEQALPLMKAKIPDHHFTFNCMGGLATTYAALGRDAEALQLREETLALRKAKLGSGHPDTLKSMNSLAWLLATAPESRLRDPARAVTLAKKTVELAPKNETFSDTLGAAYYRAGDWKAAIDAFDRAMKLRKDGNRFFLTMAHWQLGNKNEARKWYDQTVQWMEQDNSRMRNDELRRFRAEAKELLGIDRKQ